MFYLNFFYYNFYITINIIFLIIASIRDIRTLNIPKLWTFLFITWSFTHTNLFYVMCSILLIIVLLLLKSTCNLGTGDSKIIFGLSLQYGLELSIIMVIMVCCILIIYPFFKKYIYKNISNEIPVLPIVFISYIIYLVIYSV
jgi:hypothetical protein